METSPPCRFQPPLSLQSIEAPEKQWSSFSNFFTSFFISVILELEKQRERGGGQLLNGLYMIGRTTTVFFIVYWLLSCVIIVLKIPFKICARGWKQRRKQQPSGFVVAALLCNNCVQASAVDSIFPAWRQDNEGDLSCSRFISKSFCAHLCLVWVIMHAQSYFISEHLYICGRE